MVSLLFSELPLLFKKVTLFIARVIFLKNRGRSGKRRDTSAPKRTNHPNNVVTLKLEFFALASYYLYVYLPIYLPTYLPNSTQFHPTIHPSIHLFNYLSVYPKDWIWITKREWQWVPFLMNRGMEWVTSTQYQTTYVIWYRTRFSTGSQ